MSTADEWYRSPEWSRSAREDFEARLARARSHNRPQYLRIKGMSLRAAGHLDAAEELLERAAKLPDTALFESVAAWETLADMAVARQDPARAEQLYRRILAEQPSLSGTTGGVEMSLAEVLIDGGRPDQIDKAATLLESWATRPGLKFSSERFRWNLAILRLAESVGDRDTVRRAAVEALALAERGPQLPGHPDVGLVDADRTTLGRLRELASRRRQRRGDD